MEVPLHRAPLAVVKHPDVVVTLLSFLCMAFLMSWLKPSLFKAFQLPQQVFVCNLKEDWVLVSIRKGVEVINSNTSNHGYPRDLLASRARVFQSLNALRSMIYFCNLNTIEICQLSSKIEEIFGVVETAAKIEELVHVDWVKALSDQDLTCSSEIAYIEAQVNNLSSEASKFKVKEQEF